MSPAYDRDPLAGSGGRTRTTPTASRMAASATTGPSSASTAPSTSRRSEESWVEIASQPSTSSVSSFTDEIVTTGLRVGYSGINGGAMPVIPQRRRRLLQQVEAAAGSRSSAPAATPSQRRSSVIPPPAAPRSSAGSSQDEYDETESEEERPMSSSAEQIRVRQPPSPSVTFSYQQQQQQLQAQLQQRGTASAGGDYDDDDDDDEGTALGRPSSNPPTFRPQPNAFSHPPSHLQTHRSVPSPPHQHVAGSYTRSSSISQRSPPRAPRASEAPNFLHPSYREDNDAALRASLTTLLSCAAAARGLNKKESDTYGEPSSMAAGVRPSNQPMELRLVPESDLMAEPQPPAQSRTAFATPPRLAPQPQSSAPTPRPRSQPPAAPAPTPTKHTSSRGSNVSAVSSSSRSKRAAAAAAAAGGSSKSGRVTKKKRATLAEGDATATLLSPTLLTWIVSAGVVVLVSVVGFGAGFVIGREVGRQEIISGSMSGSDFSGSTASNATSCGNEIMRSSTGSTLRRFRWGAGMTRSLVA